MRRQGRDLGQGRQNEVSTSEERGAEGGGAPLLSLGAESRGVSLGWEVQGTHA